MKISKAFHYLYLGAGCAALLVSAGSVNAQTATVDVDLVVQNTLTLTVVDNLNFGTIVAIGDAVDTASLPITTAGVLGPATTTGAPAVIAIVDNALALPAQVTVEDGADGATINLDIQAVVNPTDGTSSFLLDTFFTSYNGGAATARTAGTPWTQVFSSAFGGGVNTLDIGASVTTNSVAFADAAYDGGFNVVFSY